MAQWTPPPLPADLLVRRHGPFVGRAVELAAFEQAWQRVSSGVRQVVFIGGEPGAGKSRLAAEIAGTLSDHGVAVLVGSSTADAGLPYEPFAEALDRLLVTGPPGCFVEPLADCVPQLRLLSPRVDQCVTVDQRPDESGTGRRRLFDALTTFVRRLTADLPVALILEDLHWAAPPTLAMLEHLIAGCADVPLLVVATFRTTPPDRSDELVGRLAEMHRFDGVRRLDLAGLDTEAIAEFVCRTQDLSPPTARTAAALLRDRTGGNPFFLTELCNDLQSRGGFASLSSHQTVPASIGDAIARRLAGLGVAVQEIGAGNHRTGCRSR